MENLIYQNEYPRCMNGYHLRRLYQIEGFIFSCISLCRYKICIRILNVFESIFLWKMLEE